MVAPGESHWETRPAGPETCPDAKGTWATSTVTSAVANEQSEMGAIADSQHTIGLGNGVGASAGERCGTNEGEPARRSADSTIGRDQA